MGYEEFKQLARTSTKQELMKICENLDTEQMLALLVAGSKDLKKGVDNFIEETFDRVDDALVTDNASREKANSIIRNFTISKK